METLMVDGPLDPSFISQFAQPQTNVAHGQFRGVDNVSFDVASNPHSGTFCVSRKPRAVSRRSSCQRLNDSSPAGVLTRPFT